MVRGERTNLRPVTDTDLDLLAEWFADPEVYRYWGGRALTRDEVAEKYVGARSPEVESWVVESDGAAVGYIQHWAGDEDREGGIDMFLVPSARGRGLGPDAARALAAHLIVDREWTRVTVDPTTDNVRAIRAWRRAGFRYERDLPDHEGGPAVLMVWKATHPWMKRLRAQKARHKQRRRVTRIAAAVVGVAVVVLGLALIPLPGPGWLIVAAGLFILALEFDPAERLLERILDRLETVTEGAQKAGPLAKALMIVLGLAAVAAAIAAVVLWEIPYLPG